MADSNLLIEAAVFEVLENNFITKFQGNVVFVPFDTCVQPGAPVSERFTPFDRCTTNYTIPAMQQQAGFCVTKFGTANVFYGCP